MVLIGVCMTGPLPASMSKGMPMPVKGVRMSENRMTPSGLKGRQGCSEISTCIGLAFKQHIDCYSACTVLLETSCAAHSYRTDRAHK